MPLSHMKRSYLVKSNTHMDEEELNPNHPTRDGLPYQAFAIAPDINDPRTWLLPHHGRSVNRAVRGKIGYEHTVDWQKMEEAVQLLSRQGIEGKRISASPELILVAARHLAGHYLKAGKPLPSPLSVLA